MTDVSFVLVNYFSLDRTEACIRSIVRGTKGASFEIVVSDNSGEVTAGRLAALASGIKLVQSRRNLGFGAGCNAGAAAASGRYLYFLNNDAELGNDAASIQFRYLEAHPDVGLAGARLVDEEGRPTPAFDYFPSLGIKLLGVGLFRWLSPHRYPRRDGSLTGPTDVDLVSGATLFVRRDLFTALGGFDPAFFLYCEEEDLALRVRKRGSRVVHLPEALVRHSGGASSRDRAGLKKEFYLSYFRFFRKHRGWFYEQAMVAFTLLQLLDRYSRNRERPIAGALIRWILRGHPGGESLRYLPGNVDGPPGPQAA